MFLFQLGQPLAPYACAVMLPLPSTAIHRLSLIESDKILSNKKGYPQVVSIIKGKIDKIVLTDQPIEDFNNICSKFQTGSITFEQADFMSRKL